MIFLWKGSVDIFLWSGSVVIFLWSSSIVIFLWMSRVVISSGGAVLCYSYRIAAFKYFYGRAVL